MTDTADVLTDPAVEFLTELQRAFGARREELLQRRAVRLGHLHVGELPDFLPDTAGIRESEWRIEPFPGEIADRRVEITGPVDRKMVINALNSGASVFMADFEDSNSPTWENCIEGQRNLRDALDRTIELDTAGRSTSSTTSRGADRAAARLASRRAALPGRRRPMSASLFDFGLYFFHNAERPRQRAATSTCPSSRVHLEARLWNDVFVWAQERSASRSARSRRRC